MISLSEVVNCKSNLEILNAYDKTLTKEYILELMRENRELIIFVVNNYLPEYSELIKTIDTFG